MNGKCKNIYMRHTASPLVNEFFEVASVFKLYI